MPEFHHGHDVARKLLTAGLQCLRLFLPLSFPFAAVVSRLRQRDTSSWLPYLNGRLFVTAMKGVASNTGRTGFVGKFRHQRYHCPLIDMVRLVAQAVVRTPGAGRSVFASLKGTVMAMSSESNTWMCLAGVARPWSCLGIWPVSALRNVPTPDMTVLSDDESSGP